MTSRLVAVLKSRYLRKRLLTAFLAFMVVYVLNFILPRLEPGNFVEAMTISANLYPSDRLALEQLFGIGQPLPVQFVKYLEQTFLTFPPSFGESFAFYPETVWQVVWGYLPATLLLVGVSQLIAWPLGVLLGAWIGWKPGSRSDSILLGISSFMWGVPSYWLAEIIIFVFAIELRFFPPALSANPVPGGFLAQLPGIASHSTLPILTLVALHLPYYAIVMRNTVTSLKGEDFMVAAEARGIRKKTLVFSHAARNALLPAVTNLASAFGAILSGAYLVEITFSYPGMGYLIAQSAISRDYPVLEGTLFFSAMLVIAANVLADVSYTILDPRIQYHDR